ncbi:Tim44 domain-containing protein [Marinobacterium arenosum]|uniref:Tim44 domain-containing protein n=1 Tax=Marinobacterium arenosum TaxID=2862496 RepID=UPI001C937F52|nr:TIM44-like domain-containing protein [Marinobacterium arenosum]MBY4677971.1 TIM44-like domain-containing protein [Marinobacterium arenosum]
MRTLLICLLSLFILVPLAVDEAEAGKRFGGGSSLGKSYSPPKKSFASSTTQQKQQQDATTASKTQTVTKKRSGFGGLMAGLLAGGLFGALLFGGAFEGIEFMDLLLIAGIIFVVWKIFNMRKSASAPPAYAAGGQGGYSQPQPIRPEPLQPQPQPQPVAKQAAEPLAGNSGGFAAQAFQLPSWFNQQAFLDGAREHFSHLQAAWDRADWDDIASYTSPELLAELQRERAKLDAEQHTEVVSVMAELANFIDNGDHVVVSVNFYGWLKEDGDQTTEFNEIWHLTRDMSVQNADWTIVGIEQP